MQIVKLPSSKPLQTAVFVLKKTRMEGIYMKRHSKQNRARSSSKISPNFTGQHLLHNPKTIKRLIEVARLKSNDMILEIGAGKGGLTFPIGEQVRKVIAVEIDAAYAQALKSKVIASERSHISIVHADIRTYCLPTSSFSVVANIPFSITTPILERLLGAEGRALQKATLIVEKGAAKRFTQKTTFDSRLLMWKMFFTFKLESVIPRTDFAPPPRVDAAIMIIKRRETALIPMQEAKRFVAFAAYVLRGYKAPVSEVLRGIFTPAQLKIVLAQAGLHREHIVVDMELHQWGTLFHAMLKHVPAHRWPRN